MDREQRIKDAAEHIWHEEGEAQERLLQAFVLELSELYKEPIEDIADEIQTHLDEFERDFLYISVEECLDAPDDGLAAALDAYQSNDDDDDEWDLLEQIRSELQRQMSSELFIEDFTLIEKEIDHLINRALRWR